jgi:integrase
MASIRKRGERWQARVHRKEYGAVVQSFNSKADALKWARNIESQLDLGSFAPKQTMPRLKVMVERYVQEVTPTKKGCNQERNRAGQISRTHLAEMALNRIDGAVIAQYRDQRLTEVANNTVRLELAFLSAVFEQCRREWGLAVLNPVRQIRIPKPGKPRQRRLEVGEENLLLEACNASGAYYLHSFVVLAIETGMRFGELCGVRWEYVALERRTIQLPDTKNGHPRTVPLSTRALWAISSLPRTVDGRLFPLKPGSIRSAFLTALQRGQVASGGKLLQGLRFHDLRHEAVSRLFERGLNPLEVGMISGHRTMAMLQRYAHIAPTCVIAKLG